MHENRVKSKRRALESAFVSSQLLDRTLENGLLQVAERKKHLKSLSIFTIVQKGLGGLNGISFIVCKMKYYERTKCQPEHSLRVFLNLPSHS